MKVYVVIELVSDNHDLAIQVKSSRADAVACAESIMRNDYNLDEDGEWIRDEGAGYIHWGDGETYNKISITEVEVDA